MFASVSQLPNLEEGGQMLEQKNKPYRSRKKQNYHSKVAENNSINEKDVVNEFNSYRDTSMSMYYFGFDIFSLYSPEQLAALIRDPMANNDMLREISLILYGTNGTYTNTVDYMTAIPTLDRVIITHSTSKTKKDELRKKRNKSLMESTLRTIKEKEVIRNALFCGMIDGLYFGYFETTPPPYSKKKTMTDYEVGNIAEINDLDVNASIIDLPVDYTKIVGIKNSSYVIAFNLDYFDRVTGESTENKLRKYPKEIREAYDRRKKQENPNDNGNWIILDNTKTIVHKIRSKKSEQYGRPLVLSAIKDILYNDYFTDTKRNVLNDINHKIVVQTFPEGSTKGTSALTKKQQSDQHDAVKGAVLNKNNRNGTSFVSVAAGTKLDTLDPANTDIFDEKYENKIGDKISLGMGIASSLLNGSSSGSYSSQENNLKLLASRLFQWIEQIANELNKCINKNIIKDNKNCVECKYLPITHTNKKEMVGYAKDLYTQGKGSLSLWAAACGISPEIFFALLDQELEDDIENKYPVHMTSYVLSGKSGRPTTDNPSDNTMKSRDSGGNSIPSPSDK